MLFNPKHDGDFDGLEAKLRRAEEVTSELMSDVMAIGCGRFHALGAATKVKVSRLIEAGARVVTLAYGRWDWHGQPHGTPHGTAGQAG